MKAARFTPAIDALVIECLTIADSEVLREAKRWTTGERGPIVDEREELLEADLSAFAGEALALGARVLSHAAVSSDARALEALVKDVGAKSSDAAHQAAKATVKATKDASEAVVKVADDAKKAIAEADEKSRKEITTAVSNVKQELNNEIARIFGGDHPEILEKLKPVLDKVSSAMESQVRKSTTELMEKAAKQLDPSDPTSPLAKHQANVEKQQEALTKQIEKSHTDLGAKVDELSTAIKIQDAKTSISKVTPIKGSSFESQVHAVMHDVAAGLGDEYIETGNTTGMLPRSKKGDGVLSVGGDDPKIVIEMTDSARAHWGEYFDEAERNRGAIVSLGIVRTLEQNNGQSVRTIGKRRTVLSFNPDADDPELLRTVILLLRAIAVAASSRTGTAEVETAEEKIGEAQTMLAKIDGIKTTAASIQKNATKIDGECTKISTGIHRLLDEALIALAGSGLAESDNLGISAPITGAA
jgi:hypothetical protein